MTTSWLCEETMTLPDCDAGFLYCSVLWHTHTQKKNIFKLTKKKKKKKTAIRVAAVI